MLVPFPLLVIPALPDDDDLAVEWTWARWAIDQLRDRDLDLVAGRIDPEGAWWPCAPEELLEEGVMASISQRPGCGGVVSSLHLWDAKGLRGAVWLGRADGEPEHPFFRVVLLQAVLRSSVQEPPA